ncbi:MAG: two-component system nitrogen regulation response regulator NtrX [Alteromonadaceae bacterium]|jgi:two-component system nitrogen regulation response regulator NtrX
MSLKRVIVIDDEINICRSIDSCLTPEGYEIKSFTCPNEALKSLRTTFYDLALIDIRLGSYSGVELFEQMQTEKFDVPVIFISGNASLNEAVQSLKLGAYDFLEKPFNADKLIVTVDNCFKFFDMQRKIKSIELNQSDHTLIGEHQAMNALRADITKVAKSNINVLISGESGTGKELIAQAIHEKSDRAKQNIVTVNCSAIPEQLIESALFGHVKGAFTGADKHKKGFFETANNGTLFLDEIADLPFSAQASLLRVLENKEIQKVGSNLITKVDVRVIAASHKNLKELVSKGEFREDLFYRLNVIPLNSPSLRERSSDIPLLVNHFIVSLSKKHGINEKSIDPSCYELLTRYTWPGNVRELINVIERMIIMGGVKLIKGDIPSDILFCRAQENSEDNQLTLKAFLHGKERDFLIQKLHKFEGNITKAANELDIDRSYLHKKLATHDIKRSRKFE